MAELAIVPANFSMANLLRVMLADWRSGGDWRNRAVIITDYMPPFPGADTKPTCVVKLGDSFLRHSGGPVQGFFWDVYGDDMHSPEVALLALFQSEPPPWLIKRAEKPKP